MRLLQSFHSFAMTFFTPTLILPPQGGGDVEAYPIPTRGEEIYKFIILTQRGED